MSDISFRNVKDAIGDVQPYDGAARRASGTEAFQAGLSRRGPSGQSGPDGGVEGREAAAAAHAAADCMR